MMTSEQTALVLSRLEIGFRMDSSRLRTPGEDFETLLGGIREFGSRHRPDDSWLTEWNAAWDHLARVIGHLRNFVGQMDTAIQSQAEDRLPTALEVCSSLQKEDRHLEKALQTIRVLAVVFPAGAHLTWNQMARPVEVHLETLHACAQALRIKLELLKDPSSPLVEHLLETLFAKLPAGNEDDATASDEYSLKYRQAVMEIGKEQHEVGGLADALKALLMWVETPAERMSKNLSLQLVGAGSSPENA